MAVKRYKIAPCYQYRGQYPEAFVEASTPLAALKLYLKKCNIPYKTIMRNTRKNDVYLMQVFGHVLFGLESLTVWHFRVDLVNDYSPSSGGMYALDFPGYPG